MAASFGLRFELPVYLVDLYKSLKNDLPSFNDDPSWTLPMPGVGVVGALVGLALPVAEARRYAAGTAGGCGRLRCLICHVGHGSSAPDDHRTAGCHARIGPAQERQEWLWAPLSCLLVGGPR